MLERSGDIAAALRAAHCALDLARTLHDTPGEAAAYVAITDCCFSLGQYRAAEADAQAALALAQVDSPTYIEALLRLASCLAQRGALAEAEIALRQAADIARTIGHHALFARALHTLAAGIYLTRGQFELALAADREAYCIVRNHDLTNYLHYPLITLAWVHLMTGQVEAARNFIDELAALAVEGSFIQGYHLCFSAYLALAEGKVVQALAFFDQALVVADTTNDSWLGVVVRLGISRCNRLANRYPAARNWAGDAVALADHADYPHIPIIPTYRARRSLNAAVAPGCVATQQGPGLTWKWPSGSWLISRPPSSLRAAAWCWLPFYTANTASITQKCRERGPRLPIPSLEAGTQPCLNKNVRWPFR